jgi:hypothetical protein
MKQPIDLSDVLLPGLPMDRIRACYSSAPGNEIDSGKFASKESSAALVANAFGLFLDNLASELPPLPGTADLAWPARTVELERIVRFPWTGGSHPCLDVLIETECAVIGIESKRYEPFRSSPVALTSPRRTHAKSGATECPHMSRFVIGCETARWRFAIWMLLSS